MLCVSQPGPFGDDDPFGMSHFLSNLLGSLGGISSQWDGAQQLAAAVATQGTTEANVDPLERIKMEQLCRVAELRIAQATGLELSRNGRPPEIVPLTRSQWAIDALAAYRPLFEQLSSSLSTMMQTQLNELDPGEIAELDELLPEIAPGMSGMDASAMFAGLSQLMGPMMLTMMAGSTVGQLATRSFGSYDLPIPRASDDRPLSIIAPNMDDFAADWSLPPDDIRLWVCLNELAHHAVLGVPHVRQRLTSLLGRHAAAFRADPDSITRQLSALDLEGGEMDQIQQLMGNPELALGAMRSPEQAALLPEINALTALIEGYVDHVVDLVGAPMLVGYSQLSEALRRRRVETDQGIRFVEKLFGLELTTDWIDRGTSFVDRIVEQAEEETLARIWESEEHLPTTAELDSPGLWLARIGVEVELPEADTPLDIPDYPDF